MKAGTDDPRLVRAAEYVRMSTEHQQYSTENQRAAIVEYAARHGMIIVRSYVDAGKSGLRIDGRDALKQLIADVQQGVPDFSVVLVYDVSRWGRFQDADESAHYEYICRRAGIQVAYCAEMFDNDGSPVATIVKGVKRAMAGEFSRELSAKVFAGHCRLVQMGFRQGAPPGFGLRRVLIDATGTPRGALNRGDRKSLQTDRVILVPGPAHEVEVVKRIFDLFIKHRRRESEIADLLNSEGVRTDFDRAWNKRSIRQVLTNEKYIGHNIYNRRSVKLKQRAIQNPPERWVRADHAFEALVPAEVFEAARQIREARDRRLSDEEMLQLLKALLRQEGHLSGFLIDEAPDLPCSRTYQLRFGSLIRAYSLIGYTPATDYRFIETNRALRIMYKNVVDATTERLRRNGSRVTLEGDLLRVNEEISVSIVVCRCGRRPSGTLCWTVRLDTGLQPDLTIAIRMGAGNEEVLDYYLLPMMEITGPRLRLSVENGISLDAYRVESLAYFYELTARVGLKWAA